MSLTLSYTVDGGSVTSLDLGNIFQGSNETKQITVTNDGDGIQNLYLTATDGDQETSAKKTVLGGNELAENVADSCVFGSLDGRSWYQLAGLNKKLLLSSDLSNGESVDFYVKVSIPAGSKLDAQSLALAFLSE